MSVEFSSSYAIDISGQVFGRLKVVAFAGTRGHALWDCQCECGSGRRVRGSKLACGTVTECVSCAKASAASRGAKRRSKPSDEVALHRVIGHYRSNAKRKNRPFALAEGEAKRLLLSPCHYCGLPPSTLACGKVKREGVLVSGIDRLDSGRGYEAGNVVPCCDTCNYAKREMPVQVFIALVERVHKHQAGK